MSEIDPDYSFPAAPSNAAPQWMPTMPPPPLHQPRPLSFSPQSRPRKHAHRRSGAMSEDFDATDLLSSPNFAGLGSAGFTPLSSSVPLRASAISAPLTFPSGPSSLAPPTVSPPSPPAGDGKAAPAGESPVGDFGSPRRDGTTDTRSRVQFFDSPSRRSVNFGEPGQLVPRSPAHSPPPSQRASSHKSGSLGPDTGTNAAAAVSASGSKKHSDRRKRRSFVQLFRGSRDIDAESAEADETLVPQVDVPSPVSTPQQVHTPEFVSPVVTPRNLDEAPREPELPQQPSIDLDEALSCSFEHRGKTIGAADSLLDSPFSKGTSIISPVLEEEDEDEESDACSTASSQRHRPLPFLQKTGSVHSVNSSLRRSPINSPRLTIASAKPSIGEMSVKFERTRSIPYASPISQGSHFSSSTKAYEEPVAPFIAYKATPASQPAHTPPMGPSHDHVSSLAISEPHSSATNSSKSRPEASIFSMSPSSGTPAARGKSGSGSTKPASSLPDTSSKPTKRGHARRRSLIDRIMRR